MARLGFNDPISTGDGLYVELQLARSLHVYALNEDDAGRGTLIFPCQILDEGSLQEGGRGHRLPSPLPDGATFWPVTQPTARERVWLLAAESPLAEFEGIFRGALRGEPCAAPIPPVAASLFLELRRALGEPGPARERGEGFVFRVVSLSGQAGPRAVWAGLIELRGS